MILVLAAVMAACLIAWELYFRKNWRKGVGVSLHFEEPAVYEGRELRLTETIENRKCLPLPVLEIAFRIERGVQFLDAENITESDYLYKRDVFSLLGMERILREYRLFGAKRGHYHISQASCSTYSLPLYRRYEEAVTESDDFYVYARRTDVRGILTEIRTLLGETEAARKLYEDPFAFAQIRDYTPQDPMKHVNWKATARTGGLMVNTYTSVRSEKVRIYLDVEDRNIRKQEPLTEEAVACAATLCESLLLKGLPVSLCVNARDEGRGGPAVFESARGRNHLKEIERFLTTDFAACGTTDFAAMLAEHPPADEIPVVLSKNESEELFAAALALTGSGCPGIWVVPKEKHGEVRFSSADTLRVVRREVRG